MTEGLASAPPRKYRSDEELRMREIVVAQMREIWPAARIVHELPLRYSARRIDLAAIARDEIVSVEIKSSKDVADRLAEQLRGFTPVSSLIIVALAPKWWAAQDAPGPLRATFALADQRPLRRCEVDAEAGTLRYLSVRRLGDQHLPDTAALLDMLHVAELVDIAGRHQCGGVRETHGALKRNCHNLMTGREIRRAVCRALRLRNAFDKASDPPMSSGDA